MKHPKYASSPDQTSTQWPKGVKYIVGNEGCERFSYYGMKAILWLYLVQLYKASGEVLSEDVATQHIHLFSAAVYGLGLIGAVLAEKILGKYKTILWLSIVYCLGHGALALFDHHLYGVYLGLTLIAVGSGGIKPCVSAHVGDQFGRSNWFRIERVYQIFYFIINFGSFFSTLFIPLIKEYYGYSVAFAIPGILMAIATVCFWMGRKVFVHVPAKPSGKIGLIDAAVGTLLSVSLLVPLILKETLDLNLLVTTSLSLTSFVTGLGLFVVRQKIEESSGFLAVVLSSFGLGQKNTEPKSSPNFGGHWFFARAARKFGDEALIGPHAVFKIMGIFFCVSVFWALFDQHASSWIRQAQLMDRDISLLGFSFNILPEQISAVNPIFVMLLIPFSSVVLFPFVKRLGITLTPLRKMTTGMFMAALSFVIVAIAQENLEAGRQVSILWQVLAYLVITLAEVLVSITGLEFAYTQAPKTMKSVIMGFWLLTVSFGNVLTAVVYETFAGGTLSHSFWIFAALMAGAAMIFGISSTFYRYQDFTQD